MAYIYDANLGNYSTEFGDPDEFDCRLKICQSPGHEMAQLTADCIF